MPQLSYFDSYEVTFPASADIGAFLRVKLNTSGQLVVADAVDEAIGYLTARGAKSGQTAPVRLMGAPSYIGIANEAVNIGSVVYSAAAGKVTDTQPANGKRAGVAATSTAGDNQQIRILAVEARDHT